MSARALIFHMSILHCGCQYFFPWSLNLTFCLKTLTFIISFKQRSLELNDILHKWHKTNRGYQQFVPYDPDLGLLFENVNLATCNNFCTVSAGDNKKFDLYIWQNNIPYQTNVKCKQNVTVHLFFYEEDLYISLTMNDFLLMMEWILTNLEIIIRYKGHSEFIEIYITLTNGVR